MSHPVIPPYVPKHKIRIVTAASLFDGHDAAINIMRRIIQSTRAEAIHSRNDRTWRREQAIPKDVPATAMCT